MTVENLKSLNVAAQAVIDNILVDFDKPTLTDEAVFPVAVAILGELSREYLPQTEGLRKNTDICCTINLKSETFHKVQEILSGKPTDKTKQELKVTFLRDRSARLDDHFVLDVLQYTFEYLLGLDFHKVVPSSLCSNQDKTLFTITMNIDLVILADLLDKFIVRNTQALNSAIAHDRSLRLLSGIENTNAYVKSMNDKLNEVAAIVNDFRRDVVTLLGATSISVTKILDLVTIKAGKLSKAKNKDTK